jgi:uncharacterized Zn-binding protein involved in type VI secretion
MDIRYYIQAGAKTSAGGIVRAAGAPFVVNGIPLVREGDLVDCPRCASEGMILCVLPRLSHRRGGKELALSDDLCICNCNPPPVLVADQASEYQIVGG